VDQETKGRRASFKVPDNLTGLLVNPCSIWMLGTAGEVDAPAAQLDEKEHIPRLKEESLNREKIAGQNLVFVAGFRDLSLDQFCAITTSTPLQSRGSA